MDIYFSDYFNVDPRKIERYGAFNISLVADLPLFIDPFLLFNSRKRRYRELHDGIIRYLRFLKDKSAAGPVAPGLVSAWYRFPEVRQTWFGFSADTNRGHGLGLRFADALNKNLHEVFQNFGNERITRGSHLEKLCLVKEGVGRDNISDFTTNLILGYLCEYTETFTRENVAPELRQTVSVRKVRFNYDTESWESGRYDLPWLGKDFVLLVPANLLTRDDTWINKNDLVAEFPQLAPAIPNDALRAQVNNYFRKALPRKPKEKDRREAARLTILQFPALIDHFIRFKEDRGDRATSISSEKVSEAKSRYVQQFRQLAEQLATETGFYQLSGRTWEEARRRVAFLKDAIEHKGAHRIFYYKGSPIEREEDLHILYRLTWFATPSDVSRESNDGRGPADFKISRGSRDKTIVEFKLAKNSQLKRNLERQAEIYQKASDAEHAIKVIVYFTKAEMERAKGILKKLKLHEHPDVVLIDARNDNKPSGSKA